MCTPVYVTVKTASVPAMAMHFVIAAVVAAIVAAVSFFKAFKVLRGGR
ncbi:MAG: hypothetical protein GXO32_06640 [Crenarchaeota archaeon]|nr:hypothetical protein [Thermoproteota archaeon]